MKEIKIDESILVKIFWADDKQKLEVDIQNFLDEDAVPRILKDIKYAMSGDNVNGVMFSALIIYQLGDKE